MKLVFKSKLVAICLATGLAATFIALDQKSTRAAEFSAMPAVESGLKNSSDAFFNKPVKIFPMIFTPYIALLNDWPVPTA